MTSPLIGNFDKYFNRESLKWILTFMGSSNTTNSGGHFIDLGISDYKPLLHPPSRKGHKRLVDSQLVG